MGHDGRSTPHGQAREPDRRPRSAKLAVRSRWPRLGSLGLALLLAGTLSAAMGQTAGDEGPLVVYAQVDDVISPVSAEFILESLARAESEGAALFVLRLSTPGGLDVSMRDIMQAMLASDVPTCVWVGPSGARAASAGFMIAMAADLVVMSPGTNMGSATPVQASGEAMDEALARKVVQDAIAYARSVAEQTGRPPDLAAAAVEEGRSFAAREAVELGLADAMAESLEELLVTVQGRDLGGRREAAGALEVEGARVVDVEMSLRQRILSTIANPQIAYLLMLLGTAGIYFELANPGAVLPGVVGAVAIVLALLAFQQLPISYAGLALMVLGIVFLILEINIVSYGLLAIAGLISFVLGSLLLFRGPIPEMRLQLGFVLPTAVAFLGIVGALVYLVVGAHRSRVATGSSGLVSEVGRTTTPLRPHELGKIFVHGELWKARSETEVGAGEPVEVVAVEPGLVVVVRPTGQQKES